MKNSHIILIILLLLLVLWYMRSSSGYGYMPRRVYPAPVASGVSGNRARALAALR